MPNFQVVEIVMGNAQQIKNNESMELNNEIDTIVGMLMLDLDRVEAYGPVYNEDGETVVDECMVNTYAGMELRLKVGFKTFHNLINKDK